MPPPCRGRLAELLQSKQAESAREAGASLNALVAGGGKKAAKEKEGKAPSADAVEYWRSPDKVSEP